MSELDLKKNEPWFENLRAIATVSVILLHVAAGILYTFGESSSDVWWTGNILDGFSRFCVPFFFMLSGALLLRKDYELIGYLKKRFIRIVPPLIFWSLVYIIYDHVLYGEEYLGIYGLIRLTISDLLNGSQFHLWFVYTLIGLYLLIPILRKWIKHSTQKEVLYFLIIWAVTIIAANPYLESFVPSINLINFSGYLGYMVLGYYLSNLEIKKNTLPLVLTLLGILITILGTYIESSTRNEFYGYYYQYLSTNVVLYSAGAFLLFKRIVITNSLLKQIIAFINDHSYGIYLAHILVLLILKRLNIDWTIIHPVISVPAITLFCLVVSGVTIYLLRQIKFLKIISG